MRIEVYAGGDEVELYQNGRLLGRKPCGRSTDYCAVFDGVYEPGELLAVAFENGSEVGRFSLKTAKEAAEISVKTEKGRGRDGKRLAFLDITLVDEDGLVAQDADNRLWIKTEGPVKLLGFGSVHAGHDQGFESCETTAFQGRALAILQITGEEPVTCRIGGQGLKESCVFW